MDSAADSCSNGLLNEKSPIETFKGSGRRSSICHRDESQNKKLQPIKITIPVSTLLTSTPGSQKLTSPVLAQDVNLSAQPTVTAKIGDTKIMNVKMVTNASLISTSMSPITVNNISIDHFKSIPEITSIVLDDSSLHMDSTSVDTDGDDEMNPTKLTREQKSLQASINNSKVLSEYMTEDNTNIGRKSRGRKKKVIDTASTSLSSLNRSKSMGQLNDLAPKERRGRGRPRSRAPSVSSTACARATRSRSRSIALNDTSDDSLTPKRANMRSANAEFAQKQKSFLKEIIKTQESDEGEVTDDETDDNKSYKSITFKEDLKVPPKVSIFDLFLKYFCSYAFLFPDWLE